MGETGKEEESRLPDIQGIGRRKSPEISNFLKAGQIIPYLFQTPNQDKTYIF